VSAAHARVMLDVEREYLVHSLVYAEMIDWHDEAARLRARIAEIDAELAAWTPPLEVQLTEETKSAHERDDERRKAAWITGSAYHRREAERAFAWAMWTGAALRALDARRGAT
jgi:hypothetical protein